MERKDTKATPVDKVSQNRSAETAPGRKPRKNPTLAERLGSALLTICRPDETGKLIPVIHPDRAKTMSIAEIVSVFEFDHVVLHCFGGSNHPSNLVPRPKAEHREKSRRDTSIAAKDKRLSPAHEAFQRRILVKSGQAEPDEEHITDVSKKPSRKLQGRKLQSRRFDKGKRKMHSKKSDSAK